MSGARQCQCQCHCRSGRLRERDKQTLARWRWRRKYEHHHLPPSLAIPLWCSGSSVLLRPVLEDHSAVRGYTSSTIRRDTAPWPRRLAENSGHSCSDSLRPSADCAIVAGAKGLEHGTSPAAKSVSIPMYKEAEASSARKFNGVGGGKVYGFSCSNSCDKKDR